MPPGLKTSQNTKHIFIYINPTQVVSNDLHIKIYNNGNHTYCTERHEAKRNEKLGKIY